VRAHTSRFCRTGPPTRSSCLRGDPSIASPRLDRGPRLPLERVPPSGLNLGRVVDSTPGRRAWQNARRAIRAWLRGKARYRFLPLAVHYPAGTAQPPEGRIGGTVGWSRARPDVGLPP
jgi:hypothetical protein